MKMTEEKLNPMLIIDIGRARRLYDEGKNAEEIAAVVRRPVTLMEKWIGELQNHRSKETGKKRVIQQGRSPGKDSCF